MALTVIRQILSCGAEGLIKTWTPEIDGALSADADIDDGLDHPVSLVVAISSVRFPL